ncbi:hypothetical protein V8F20_006095 [Naviculisporaceae sp. PSN 640]
MATSSPTAGSSARPAPAKGILKRPSARANPSKTANLVSRLNAADEAAPEQTSSLLEEAVKQAEILQRLKESGDIREPVALEVFERLSQFPIHRSPLLSASNPSQEDASEFISAVERFVPSEYDDLIEERNILGNCGYTLCPRPRRTYVGEWKIHTTGIARSADLNRWCSEKCAVRALYIKVQLDNPTYIRRRDPQAGGKVITVTKIELREEDRPQQQQLAQQSEQQKQPANAGQKTQHTADEDIIMEDETVDGDGNGPASKTFLTAAQLAALQAERIGERSIGRGTLTLGANADKHSAVVEAAANLKLNLPIRGREPQVEVTIKERVTSAASVKAPDPRKAGSENMVEGYKVGKKFALKKERKNGTEKGKSTDGEDSNDDDDDDADDFFTKKGLGF